MDELMKSLEGSKEEVARGCSAPREVHGVLSVHIKSIKLISSETFELHSTMLGLLQVRMSVCGHMKVFSVNRAAQDMEAVVCDQLKHFVIELHEKTNHSFNEVTVELVISSPLLPGKVSPVGRAVLHIPALIHQCPISGECVMKHVDTFSSVALLTADWAFCYGSYGYGESYQLHHNFRRSSDYLHFSLFPRILPTNTHTADFNGLILTPHVIKHPSYIPFTEHAQLCGHETTSKEQQWSQRQLTLPMKRLEELHRQFQEKSTDRRERLKFLEELVLSSVGYREESIGTGVTARKPV